MSEEWEQEERRQLDYLEWVRLRTEALRELVERDEVPPLVRPTDAEIVEAFLDTL